RNSFSITYQLHAVGLCRYQTNAGAFCRKPRTKSLTPSLSGSATRPRFAPWTHPVQADHHSRSRDASTESRAARPERAPVREVPSAPSRHQAKSHSPRKCVRASLARSSTFTESARSVSVESGQLLTLWVCLPGSARSKVVFDRMSECGGHYYPFRRRSE